MKIAFRTDATKQIGTGHFMRCLTLADALKERGSQILFISRHLPEHLRIILEIKEHEFIPLRSNPQETISGDLAHSCWLGVSQYTDAQDSIYALSDRDWDWLVVDHYALDSGWESALRKATKYIMSIDDIADRQHDCDILLDQNYYINMDTRYTNKVPAHCRLFLGPRYALLRGEFRQLREQVKPRTGSVHRVLVFFGGVDADNYTGRAIEVLSNLPVEGLQVGVVIGVQHPFREQIELACLEQQYDCYVQTNRMAELMAEADLAIGAAGSATWERCCLGVPALTVSMSENQTEIAKGLDILGAGKYVDSQQLASEMGFNNAILNLLQNNAQTEMLSKNAYSVVDGLGVDRLCEALVDSHGN